MKITLCTLFEGNYHFGFAALANSLAASGYQGTLWAGYRGTLPAWLTQSPGYDQAAGRLAVTPTFELRMLLLDTPLHFAYYKPTFIQDLLATHASDADVVAYMDPDIVVKCDWPSLSAWFTEDGISLSEDVNWHFPARHPKRLQWNQFFAEHGRVPTRALDRYYNSGFVAASRSNLAFLQEWRALCELVLDHNKGVKHLKSGGPTELFHSTDQDAMNFALGLCDAPLNTAGPEAMDFVPGGYYLSHATGSPKPWHGDHVRQALRGWPPTAAAKCYYEFVDGPLRAYPERTLKAHRMSLRIAAAIGRFYRRA